MDSNYERPVRSKTSHSRNLPDHQGNGQKRAKRLANQRRPSDEISVRGRISDFLHQPPVQYRREPQFPIKGVRIVDKVGKVKKPITSSRLHIADSYSRRQYFTTPPVKVREPATSPQLRITEGTSQRQYLTTPAVKAYLEIKVIVPNGSLEDFRPGSLDIHLAASFTDDDESRYLEEWKQTGPLLLSTSSASATQKMLL
uniref:UBX domain-containing protein n=1 Tax=Angiostrongylus cantonensis TaxID=6313 RepID=A0A0K0DIR0_ANGCA